MDWCHICRNDGYACICEFRTLEAAIQEIDQLRAEVKELKEELETAYNNARLVWLSVEKTLKEIENE
jgi:uncharacterized protein (DUF3084 family)